MRDMARPQVSADIVNSIRFIWASNPKQTGIEVWRRYHKNPKTDPSPQSQKISKRKVQQIVAKARKVPSSKEFELVPWHPWVSDEETPEDSAFLLKMDVMCLVDKERHLFQHEAAWGRRLRATLEKLPPEHQFFYIWNYSIREITAFNLNDPQPYTADLDGTLGFWVLQPEDYNKEYEAALRRGLIPPPLAYGDTNDVTPGPEFTPETTERLRTNPPPESWQRMRDYYFPWEILQKLHPRPNVPPGEITFEGFEGPITELEGDAV